jgi:predicted small lipoprotein YifL
MKRYLNTFAVLLGGLMVLSSLTACGGSGSDSPEPVPEPPKQATSVKVDYTATVSQQLLDVATVTVRFIGDNGQVTSEQMASTMWTKTVTMALPAKAGLNIQPTLKGAVNDGQYTLSAKGVMDYNWLDANGKQMEGGSSVASPDMEAIFFAAGLGQYLGSISSNCQLACQFGTDYSVNITSVTWGGNADGDNTQHTGIADDGATGENR